MMEPEQQARPWAPHTVPAQDLRIVGGNLALDLCNSRSGPHDGGIDVDAIVEVDHIVHWAVHAGVLTAEDAAQLTASEASASIADATSALTMLLHLREQAHSVFGALAAGGEPEPAAMEALRQADLAAIARAHQVRLGDRYAFSWPASARTVVIDRVAHAAAELLHDGPLSRVKQCAGCSFLFVDESKNGSRRWCSMDDCGREAKMRLYVERRRARDRSERPSVEAH
jgi:predicted RNA-binding Zn ribbon-like protein